MLKNKKDSKKASERLVLTGIL
eukprot:COSAG05_NODE_16530_length_344_cov_0.636735_1_plen_21_part_01